MAGVAAPIVLLSSALNGGSSITIGNAAINATSGLTEGSAAVAFAIASSQISNAATITFSGCAIAVHHHRRSADEPIDGALVAIDRAMLMSMENSVFSGGSAVAVRDSFAFIKSDGSSAGIMYLSYPTVEEGSVLLQGSAFALSSGALTVEANNNNPQSPGVCVGNAPFCASSAIFDNAPETDANFLPPLLALTAPPPSCPL